MSIIDFDSGNAKNKKNKATDTSDAYYQDLFRQFQDSIFDDSYEEDDEEKVYDYLEQAAVADNKRLYAAFFKLFDKLCVGS